MNVASIFSNNNVTVFLDGDIRVIPNDHPNYKRVVEILKSKEYSLLPHLIDIRKSIENASDHRLAIVNGKIFYKNEVMENVLVDKILAFIEQKAPFEYLIKFLENLLRNPSESAKKELYLFLETGNLPVTDDGCFLAYKRVRSNYKDIHSGNYDNHVGANNKMDRKECDDNRNNVCSRGFHFCSLNYLPNFSSHDGSGKDRVMILKINPMNVTSIPSDYSNTKGRCCEYDVVGEWKVENNVVMDAFKDVVVVKGHTKGDKKKGGANVHRFRDAKGHFISWDKAEKLRKAKGPKRDANGRFIPKKK